MVDFPHKRPVGRAESSCPAADGEETLARVKLALRDALTRYMGESGLSREQVLDRINARLPGDQGPISLRAFTGWLEADPRRRPPADILPAVAQVIGPGPICAVANAAGLHVVSAEEADDIALGRALRIALRNALRPLIQQSGQEIA